MLFLLYNFIKISLIKHAHFIVGVLFLLCNKGKKRGREMYIEFQNNPCGRSVGDCAVRAVSRALEISWEDAYWLIARNGADMCDMPSSDSVWGAVLRQNGFYRKAIPTSYPVYYSAKDFCKDHPYGTFVLGFGGHVATVVNGNLYDSWDSSNEVPQFYWFRPERS